MLTAADATHVEKAQKHRSSSILEWFKESWTCTRPSTVEWCVNYLSSIILRPWYPCWTDLTGEEEEVEDDKNYVLMSKLAILTEFNHVTLIALCRQRQERCCMSEGLYNDLCNLQILLKCLCASHDVQMYIGIIGYSNSIYIIIIVIKCTVINSYSIS